MDDISKWPELLDNLNNVETITIASRNTAAKATEMINLIINQQLESGSSGNEVLINGLKSVQERLMIILNRAKAQLATLSSSLYLKVHEAASEIRLVTILPGQLDDEICCTLEVVSLIESCPGFKGLSYMWGSQYGQQVEITLQGSKFPITANLASALQHLRSQTGPVTYWIDAICINQSDLDERSSQVRYMRQIYLKATEIVSWIGDEEEGSGDAMKLMVHLGEKIEEDVELFQLLRIGSRGESKTFRDVVKSSLGQWLTEFLIDKPETWHKICSVTNRPYWRRAWVMQETAFTDDLRISCGGESMSWFHFQLAGAIILLVAYQLVLRDASFLVERSDDGWCKVKELRERYRSGGYPSFSEVLLSLRQCHATDPRDKIYAFMGLHNSTGLEIDYHKSTNLVYQEATQFIITESNSLDMLVACQGEGHVVKGLPSWVPDYSTGILNYKTLVLPEAFTLGSVNKQAYSASKNSTPVVHFSDSLNSLTVSGIELDQITELSRSGDDENLDEYYESIFSLWEHFKATIPTETDPEKREWAIKNADNFWRVLIADRPSPTSVPLRHRIHESQVENYKAQFEIRFELRPISSLELPPNPNATPIQLAMDFCSDYIFATQEVRTGRRVALTASGHFALVPSGAKVGDCVAVFLGAQVPFVVRPVEDCFGLVGECFVHGYMDGEVMTELDEGKKCIREFILV